MVTDRRNSSGLGVFLGLRRPFQKCRELGAAPQACQCLGYVSTLIEYQNSTQCQPSCALSRAWVHCASVFVWIFHPMCLGCFFPLKLAILLPLELYILSLEMLTPLWGQNLLIKSRKLPTLCLSGNNCTKHFHGNSLLFQSPW